MLVSKWSKRLSELVATSADRVCFFAAHLPFSVGPRTSCGSRAASEHVMLPLVGLNLAVPSVFYLIFGVLNAQE
jgi:hypothetical protein